MDKKKIITAIVVLFTVVLAGVAVFTAVRLYQQRNESVAPTAPTSQPRAAEEVSAYRKSCDVVTFSLAGETICGDSCDVDNPCPAGNTCSTTTNKCVLAACLEEGASCDETQCSLVEVEGTPVCGDPCTSDSDCPSDNTCSAGKCALSSCLAGEVTCSSDNCSVVGDTSTPTPTPTTAPELPNAGVALPTLALGSLGLIVMVGALLLLAI